MKECKAEISKPINEGEEEEVKEERKSSTPTQAPHVSINMDAKSSSDTSSEGSEERKRENITRAISDNMLSEPQLLENMNLRELASMQSQNLAWNELPISQKFRLFKLPYLLGGIGAIFQCFSMVFAFVPD